MNQDKSPALGPLLLTLLAGAAVGAVLAALTTPRTGAKLREDPQNLNSRSRRRAEAMAAWDEMEQRTVIAGDLNPVEPSRNATRSATRRQRPATSG